MSDDDTMTLEEVRALAERLGVPGPDADEHPLNEDGSLYGGDCFCQDCLRGG